MPRHYTNDDHKAADAVEKLHRMTDHSVENEGGLTADEALIILSLCDHKKDAKRYRKRIMKLHKKKYPND